MFWDEVRQCRGVAVIAFVADFTAAATVKYCLHCLCRGHFGGGSSGRSMECGCGERRFADSCWNWGGGDRFRCLSGGKSVGQDFVAIIEEPVLARPCLSLLVC